MAKISWLEGLSLERDVAFICNQQEKDGVLFDKGKALFYISKLEQLKEEKYKEIRPYLTYTIDVLESKDKETGEYNYVRKIKLKNGGYNSSIISHYPDNCNIVEGCFSRIQINEPSISRRNEVIKQLLKHGWKPTVFTEKGSPKLTQQGEPVESLLKVGDFGKALAEWYTYNHRQSQIRGFLEYVRGDGRIAAQINTCATNTFRGAHRVVANIPRPTSIFGKEMRSLFRVASNRKFVGCDASGLELRMLAHHMKDPEYIKQILEGDIHSYNQVKAGLTTRDQAKTFIYAFLYGAGDLKIGSIIGGNSTDGKRIKDTFFEAIPSLATLINKVKSFSAKSGWVPSIDNRKIYLRSSNGKIKTHTALNALLQANGSIVVKRAMVIANEEVKRRGLAAFQILFYHDEFAYDSHPDCAEEVGNIMAESIKLAGEYYNLNIPLAGEYKIGIDWSIH